MSKPHGYCLKNIVNDKLEASTFAETQDDCWAKSFDLLNASFQWMKPYWKKKDESIRAARGHGYVRVPVRLTEVKA
jgi:hypothetical protein